MEEVRYEILRSKKKYEKLRESENDDADFDEMTVSEDEFDEDEKKRFNDFLRARREKKEAEFKTKEEMEENYDDDPYKVKEDELLNEDEQLDRVQKHFDNLKT
jgi:hypothetical protein